MDKDTKFTKKEKFIEKFVSFYIKKRELEYALMLKKNLDNKKDFEKANEEIISLLNKYSILFEDLRILEKFFNKVVEKESAKFVAGSFRIFLEWIFENLYKQKIINKKDFKGLEKWLSNAKFDSKPISIWPY
tara:strand:+ start:6 stop:401 length:396 start_codon:yes stop_codon:yes gene_type:complete